MSAQVPILIDHGATIIESALVVEYLDKAYPEAGTKLYPDDPAAAFKVLTGSCCLRPNDRFCPVEFLKRARAKPE